MVRRTLALSLALLTITANAHAAEDACIAAHLDAQKTMAAKKLRAAREKLLACGGESCPGMLRADCAGWLASVERDLPTVLPTARDTDGVDLFAVEVTIDGEKVLDRLDGAAIALDPGPHTIAMRHERRTVTMEILARVGEKNRVIIATFARAETKKVPTAPVPAGPTRSAGPYIVAGAGVVAFSVFGYLAITGDRTFQDLESSCAPNCDRSDTDALRRRYLYGDIALGIGIAALGAATTWWILDRGHGERPVVGVSVNATGAALVGRF